MSLLATITASEIDGEILQRSVTIPVLVQFTSNWCGPCRLQKPLLQKIAEQRAMQLHVVMVDVQQCTEFARQCGVQGVPQLRLFVAGQIVMRAEGLLPEANLLQRLQPWLGEM